MVFSLFAKLIEIFQGFFKKSPLVIKTNIEQLPMLIEKNFELTKANLEDFSAKKMSEAKYLISKSNNILGNISKKELEGKENERFNKAALTSKRQLENQLKRLLEKIDPKDRGNNLDDARHYSGESYALLANEIVSFRKNIIYMSFYLKEEMKELGETLQEILNIFNEMNLEFKKSNELFEFEKIKETSGKIIKKKKHYKELENQKQTLLEKLQVKQEKQEEQKTKLTEKATGKEMQAVKSLEEEMVNLMNQKQDLKTEISGLILSIDRPMNRFKQLVDSGRWKLPNEEKEILNQFIVNPILALKKDPKAELFKKVLLEIRKAIEDGSVELKDKEKEKRLAAIQELINFDFFGKVFWKMNELQKKQIDLNKELEKSAAKKEIEKDNSKIKETDNELGEIKSQIEEVTNEQESVKKEIEKDLTIVKEFAGNVLGKTVIFEEEGY
ncbi:MAG: hypothetical protein WC821_02205 [archaeon]|jgi:hypothetical protein